MTKTAFTLIRRTTRRRWGLAAATLLAITGLLGAAGPAQANTSGPAWSLSVTSAPTNFAPGDTSGDDTYQIMVTNSGGAPASGSWTVTDTLPAGLTPDPSGALAEAPGNASCSSSGQTVTCTSSDVVPPSMDELLQIPVDVAGDAPASGTNTVTISGGGALTATSSTQTQFNAGLPAGGFVPGTNGLSTSLTNADGTPDTQAGSHPYALNVHFNLNSGWLCGAGDDIVCPVSNLRDITVNLPQGVVVNPNATSVRCTESELENPNTECPDASAVGLVTTLSRIAVGPPVYKTEAIYNMVPPPGVPAEFAFDAAGSGLYIHLLGQLRTGTDYGLSSTTSDITARFGLVGLSATFWGSPSDPSHDPDRGYCAQASAQTKGQSCPVPASSTPFLTMPSACSGSLSSSASADFWEAPGSFTSDSYQFQDASGNPVGVSGCDRLDFSPSMSVEPDTSVADSPSGLDVDLSVPQSQNLGGLAEANLKAATVVLPAGMSVNPASANGLEACTPGEIGLDDSSEPSCPDASKIGTVTVDTPLLSDPMTGGIYVAEQNDNPFGSLLAIYVTAEADGALIKLAGHVVADPVTGQLTTTFDNNPQLPFSDFKLDFWGGPGAVLTSPGQCGSYSSQSSLSPWSGTGAVLSSEPFSITSGCQTGFAPTFTAGSESTQAGAYSPFVVTFGRQDADQFFSGLSATLPDGEVAKLAGVGECTTAELAAAAAKTGAEEQADPSCPSDSQVGTVETGAGSGSDPFYLPGKVYLTGPYQSAPYGLAVVVPAVAGPYDLGTVVIRQQLQINPTTAQVTVVSDPFPTILQGIPLQVRSVTVTMNRSDFTVNPTNCDPMSTSGTLSSTGGLSASVSSPFQAGGCQELGFSPKLTMRLTGKGKTRSGDHPNLISTLTQPPGQANIHNVRVALPLSIALDPNNSQHVCNYYVAQAVHGGSVGCPASTIVGRATAVTPLLSQPLTGAVYLVQGIRFSQGHAIRTLPSLLVPLRGQIALDLRAQTSVSAGKLVTTFPTIPDAAVSKFTLTINGGPKGILVITGRGRTICGTPQITDATLGAQSGNTTSPAIQMSTPCRAPHKHPKHRKKHT